MKPQKSRKFVSQRARLAHGEGGEEKAHAQKDEGCGVREAGGAGRLLGVVVVEAGGFDLDAGISGGDRSHLLACAGHGDAAGVGGRKLEPGRVEETNAPQIHFLMMMIVEHTKKLFVANV